MSRAQAAMIPASLYISQLLTYFLGNLKAFFHSALEITKDSLNSTGSLLPVSLPYSLMAVAVLMHVDILLSGIRSASGENHQILNGEKSFLYKTPHF